MRLVNVDDTRLGFPSASKMGAIFACDGQQGLEKIADRQKISPPQGSKAAEYGTLIHQHAQTGDVSGLDEHDADLVVEIRQTEEKIVGDWIAATGHTLSDVTVYRELRLWYPGYFSGQGDTIVINFKNQTALISDTKSGRMPVPPPVENWQLRALALAVHKRFNVAPIRTLIIQPYAKEMPYCDYTAEHLQVIEERIKERLDLVRHPGLKRIVNDYCKHCGALHICPEAREDMQKMIRDYSRMDYDSKTPDQIVEMFKEAKLGKECAEAILDMIKKHKGLDPESLPGLVKAKDQTPRSIINTKEFVLALVNFIFGENQNLPDIDSRKLSVITEILGIMKISFADAAEFLKRFQSCTKQRAEIILTEQFNEFVALGFRQGSVSVKKENL